MSFKKKRPADGDRIVGIDFGKERNQMVVCKLKVDSSREDGFRIIAWDAIDLGKVTSLRHAIDVFATLDPPGILAAEWVLLEQQSARNRFCYGFAHSILMWYKILYPDTHVRFVSPRSKFTILDSKQKYKCGNSYYAQKKWAVHVCKSLIELQPEEQVKVFHTWEKKDDLADAFLYARAFLNENIRIAK